MELKLIEEKILESFFPENFEEYEINFEKKAACERYFEKIVESLIYLAHLVSKNERFNLLEKNKVFDLLSEKQIITKNLSNKLKNAKGMRNIISHKYGDIDDKIVFETMKEEFISDSKEFINKIKEQFSENF